MGGIFISYRREDSGPYAGRLKDALSRHFGEEQVFRDIDRINPGERWPGLIEQSVGSCDALLALIGPTWLAVGDKEARRRLDNPDDYVRHEIATALRRPDVVVIPVLVGSTSMPAAADLPKPLAALAECNATRITDESWDDDVARLTKALDKKVQRSDARAGQKRLSRRSRIVLGAVAAVVVVAALVAYLLWPSPSSQQPPPSGSSVLLDDLGHPHGLAVDSAGDVYVAEYDKHRVLKLAAGATDPIPLQQFTDLVGPTGVAVDRALNVYVSDLTTGRVLKLAKGADTADKLPFEGAFALSGPRGVAVDSKGNVYVADQNNGRVLKLPKGATSPTQLPITFSRPAGVAVDSDDNLYVTDEGNPRVYEVYERGGRVYPPESLSFSPGVSVPRDVDVDVDGNVYVTNADNVLKLAKTSGKTTTLAFDNLIGPGGLALGADGTVYVSDWGHNRVLTLPPG